MEKISGNPALVIVVNGEEHEVTFEDLTLSNHLTLQALISILSDKGLINEGELIERVKKFGEE